MHLSSSAAAWIAIGAAAAAVLALGLCLAMWLVLRRVRKAQLVLVGGGKEDLVDFAVSLQGRIDDLHRAVDEIAAGLVRVDRRIDDCVANTSIVRYDAYDDAGGHQSATLAVLDAARSGVVVSAIQGRDYARIYMKELDRGKASVALRHRALLEQTFGRGATRRRIARAVRKAGALRGGVVGRVLFAGGWLVGGFDRATD